MSEQIQDDINNGEWSKPENWSGKWPFSVYKSKLDSRLFVPAVWNHQFSPYTINYRHRLAIPYMVFGTVAFFAILYVQYRLIRAG